MDSQHIINITIGIAGAFGGYFIKLLLDSMHDLKTDLKDLAREVHTDYVKRDDFTDAVKRIETMLERIFDKLDDKADK